MRTPQFDPLLPLKIDPVNGWECSNCGHSPTACSAAMTNVLGTNNWQVIDSCFPSAPEALSMPCGGQGVTVFYGMANPVRALADRAGAPD